MKNMIFIGSIILFTGTTAFAQSELAYNQPNDLNIHKGSKTYKGENKVKKEKTYNIPSYSTEQQFMVDFPKVTDVSWNTKGYEEASFILNGKSMKAFYDYDSKLIGTTTAASYDDLPQAAKKYIQKHFKDYTPQSVIMFDDNEFNSTEMLLYGDPFEGEDNYFVELSNNNKIIVLQIGMDGLVSFFKDISNNYNHDK
jgi:hypothetical protein